MNVNPYSPLLGDLIWSNFCINCDVASLNTLTMAFMCVVTTSYLRNLDIQFENMGEYTNLKCGLGFVATSCCGSRKKHP